MKKRRILYILLILVMATTLIYNLMILYKKPLDIEKVIQNKNYAYLSDNTKEYIKNYYNTTGELLLTEKNKKNNEEYLNPDYIEYLDNLNGTKQGYIPNILTADYNYKSNIDKASDINNLPKKYNSVNVDGNNYVTPLKKQFGELCWNYAFTAIIESKLLRTGLKTNANTLDLSERMMDYATSIPISTIDVEQNPYYGDYSALNTLADGGNEYRYSSALVNGMFPIDESNWNYDLEYMGKIKPEDLYDLNNINYQVNEVLYLKDNNAELGLDEQTNKIIKQAIMDHGAVGVSLRVGAGKNYVRYKVSTEDRLNSETEYNYLYYKPPNAQYISNNHSVALIGWDDEYTRKICVKDNGELEDAINKSGVYSCSSGELKTINGAWITKDSANQSYHYLAFETINSPYFMVTDISERNWDNVYSSSNKKAYTKNNYTYTFNKLSNKEKLNSIKFYSQSAINNLEVYINTNDGKGDKLLTKMTTETGGLYTIPVNEEIFLSNNTFTINIYNGYAVTNFSVFTNNTSNEIILENEDINIANSFNYQEIMGNYENVIVTSGISKNLNSNISYIIKNSSGDDVTSLFDIMRTKAIGNYINSAFRFNKNVPLGEYTVDAYVDGTKYDTFKININFYMEKVVGDGSEESPFIITNPAQLDMIRLNKYNYYKLGNDIDLTYDTQDKNGRFYNNGKGWEPIEYGECRASGDSAYCNLGFSGIFEGDNHKIIGLYINRPEENIVGLFKNTYNDNYSALNFRNITLKDVNITGNDFVGSLIGLAYGTTYERHLMLENITVTGNVKGNNYVGGIIGKHEGGTGLKNYLVPETKCVSRHCLNNLLNSATVEGNNYVGGIIGLLETQTYYNPSNPSWRSTIDANYLQNNGKIISKNKASGLIGHTIINNGNIVTINDSIITGFIDSKSSTAIVNDIDCTNKDDTYPTCSFNLNNIYYTTDKAYNDNVMITSNNVKKYSILELTNRNLYNSFNDFENQFTMEKIDNINRIPFVSNNNIEYTKINDITIDKKENINLFNYVEGSKNIIYDITDESIATTDENGIITPIKKGNTTIHITSYYDGYDKDINLTVNIPEVYTITYNLNGGSSNNPNTYTDVTDTFTLNNPTKVGYEFIGWTGSNGETPEKVVTIEKGTRGNLTFNANWIPNKYTVTFNANGGEGTMSNQEFTYGTSKKIAKNIYTRTGYTFTKWNTKADGTGNSYTDEQLISITENKTLYAIWEEEYSYIINEYTIDDDKKIIDKIDINTTIDDYKKNLTLNTGYTVEIDSKTIDDKNVLYTGSKTKIYQNNVLIIEYTNIIRGESNGDGKINYLDYVNVYNHIQKTKHPDINKKLLENEFLTAADMSNDNKVNYLDYVQIYNKIKEMKERE